MQPSTRAERTETRVLPAWGRHTQSTGGLCGVDPASRRPTEGATEPPGNRQMR